MYVKSVSNIHFLPSQTCKMGMSTAQNSCFWSWHLHSSLVLIRERQKSVLSSQNSRSHTVIFANMSRKRA